MQRTRQQRYQDIFQTTTETDNLTVQLYNS